MDYSTLILISLLEDLGKACQNFLEPRARGRNSSRQDDVQDGLVKDLLSYFRVSRLRGIDRDSREVFVGVLSQRGGAKVNNQFKSIQIDPFLLFIDFQGLHWCIGNLGYEPTLLEPKQRSNLLRKDPPPLGRAVPFFVPHANCSSLPSS